MPRVEGLFWLVTLKRLGKETEYREDRYQTKTDLDLGLKSLKSKQWELVSVHLCVDWEVFSPMFAVFK